MTMLKVAHQLQEKKDFLTVCSQLQKQYESKTSSFDRKEKGQIFTPPSICRFMARLFSTFPQELKLLDPGAGVGLLTAAVCERVRGEGKPRTLNVHLFETDPALIPLLKQNMAYCRRVLHEAGHTMSFTIHNTDFILSNSDLFGQEPQLFGDRTSLGYFDAVIMNPPYFKINKGSTYARVMAGIIHGQPNIYALFMALAAEMLRPGGEFVAITPRSFCNGPYFREFRRWFFKRMSLQHVHLFESRTDTFKAANILQESLITVARCSDRVRPSIRISTSFGPDIPYFSDVLEVPTTRVIDDSYGEMVIRIPASAVDAEIVDLVESWPARFTDLGLRISTGPVVTFRATEYLLASPTGKKSAPLLSMHNVKPFKTTWPVAKNGKPTAFKVCPDSLALLLPTKNYVLLRRFSAKEERRRLTASFFLHRNESGPYVALENHLNYVYHSARELTEEETYGLTALFNSALLDRYFRTISGNTQVNATEIRTMKFPPLAKVAGIGRRLKKQTDFPAHEGERVVLEELGITGPLRQHLIESTL